MNLYLVLLMVCLLLGGCITQSLLDADSSHISRQALLSGEALFGERAAKLETPEQDLLSLDSEMLDFIEAHVSRGVSKEQQLRSLARALLSEESLGIRYHPDKTLTAREAFHFQRGNCLAFSNLFVAMAREIGLKVYFQQVDVPPAWSSSESFVVLSQHINVASPVGRHKKIVVDFNLAGFRGNYNAWQGDDAVAFSQYYSNISMDFLSKGDMGDAFRYLKKAIRTAPEEANLWVNLGALYSRNKLYDHAEAAYLQALGYDRQHNLANSNLARLYEHQGESEKAAQYLQRVQRFRQSNPYYHFWRARDLLQKRDYQQSMKHIAMALRKKKDEHQFYALRSRIHRQSGNLERSREDLERARDYAVDNNQRAHYTKQLEAL